MIDGEIIKDDAPVLLFCMVVILCWIGIGYYEYNRIGEPNDSPSSNTYGLPAGAVILKAYPGDEPWIKWQLDEMCFMSSGFVLNDSGNGCHGTIITTVPCEK
jgi:hypothetical protein